MTYVLGIPHDETMTDTWAKAKGLADYADKHGFNFGHLVMAKEGLGGQKEAESRIKGSV